MSAWTVDKGHIDMLVQSMIDEGIIVAEVADEVGKKLWTENFRSVNYRYRGRKRRPSYCFTPASGPLEEAIVLLNIGCYEYQTCEHPEWDASQAHHWMRCLTAAIVHRMGIDSIPLAGERDGDTAVWHYTRTWEKSNGKIPWGITNIEQAVKEATCPQQA